MFRKVIAVLMIAAMLFALSLNVVAYNIEAPYLLVSDETISENDYAAVQNGIELMLEHHLYVPKISQLIAIKKEDGKILYTLQAGRFIDQISVRTEADAVIFNVSGGGRQDEIIVTSDGTLVDGNEITMNVTIENVTAVQMPMGALMPRYSDRSFVTTCPYGYISDYTELKEIVRIENIELQQEIENMTFSAFVDAILMGISIYLTGTHENVFVDIFSDAASDLFAWLNDDYPVEDAMSCICYCYYHKDADVTGYISDYGAAVTKHAARWYPRPNMSGAPTPLTRYEVYRIY